MASSYPMFSAVMAPLALSVFQLCGAAGIPPSSRIRNEDYESLVKAEMPNPTAFNTAEDFAYAYQSYNLLRKYDSFPINIDRPAVALSGFLNSEAVCGQVNLTVDALPYLHGVPLEQQPQSVFESSKRLIERALGRFDWEEFQASCNFSNGASTRCKREASAPVFKLDGKMHVTINCRDLAVHLLWCNASWKRFYQEIYGRESDPYTWVEVVPGSRFDTVPKDSQKDRPICIEPDLNMFCQKGIGAMVRRRLRRRGITLNDQTLNQWLAMIGSIDGSLATIDLSSASDSVSLWLCERLLPKDWYEAMLITRSAYVQLPSGKYHRLQKVSSMGNGFTFELESLIFWALSVACTKAADEPLYHLSVYGDDIIVPTRAAKGVIDVLAAIGFATNKDKTFLSGPFRESCGKHYFLGVDVSPFKVEALIETWADVYHFCNSLQEWGDRLNVDVSAIVATALHPIPPRNRCYVPLSYSSKAGIRTRTPRKEPVFCKELMSLVYKFHYMREVTNDHDLNGPVAYLASMLQREQKKASRVLDEYNVEPPSTHLLRDVSWAKQEVGGYSRLSRTETNHWVRSSASSSVW